MFKILCSMIFLLLLPILSNVYAGQVNAFIYHRFDETRYPSTDISSAILAQQLEYVKGQGIEVISLGETVKRLTSGEDLPDHSVSFCVDDAFRSLADVGMPIFRQYGVPLTLFVNTAAVGTHGYLNWQELRALAAEGVVIGNHTDTHAYLVELKPAETMAQWKQRVREDILRAQELFQKNLGTKPTLFAYPYGEYSPAVVEIIKDLGFSAAFAQQSGVIYSAHNFYNLPRFPMGGPFATVAGFKAKLAMQPLPILDVEPFDPIIRKNPPVLHLRIAGQKINPKRINCFAQGDNHCWVEADVNRGDGWYQVIAEQPLTGRRNKYTLTLQSDKGSWLWYSHPWINAKNPVN